MLINNTNLSEIKFKAKTFPGKMINDSYNTSWVILVPEVII